MQARYGFVKCLKLINWHRASFEELVLDEAGQLKWNRLENLLQESSRSVGYDPSQLWLLAGSHDTILTTFTITIAK